MNELEKTLLELKIAELQFRLASSIRLSITARKQVFEVPFVWAHGEHQVQYDDIYLTNEQSDIAADYLQRNTTYLMAVTIRNAIKRHFKNPKEHENFDILSTYQISRLIRNSFTHSPIIPIWCIDNDCKDKEYRVCDIIKLNTHELDGKLFDWRHYGGPLALFKLSKYVRIQLLSDKDTGNNRAIPKPENIIYQQGNLILKKIDQIANDGE